MAATIWITQTLSEFGRMLGFEELAFDQQQTVQLSFERLGILEMRCGSDSTLVYLKRPVSAHHAAPYRRALEICHYDESELDWMQATLMKDGQLALVTRIPHEEFQLSNLERVITKLGELHEQIAEVA